jgi:hypothetical protein
MVIENDCYLYSHYTGMIHEMSYYDIIGTNLFCYPISPGVYKIHDPDVN